jgi:sugar phosphate isomerase/epimerase
VAFDGYDLAIAFDELAALGVDAIELAYITGYIDFDEDSFDAVHAHCVRHLMEERGLRARSVAAHVNMGLAEAPNMVARRIGFAEAVGASFLISNAAPRVLRREFLKNLEVIAPLAERAGVAIALENPGHGEVDLIGNAQDGRRLLDEIGLSHVGLNYDAGNVFTYSGEAIRPEDDLCAGEGWIIHVHLKDVWSTPDGWEFAAIGSGVLDYRAVLSRLGTLTPAPPCCIELPLRLVRPGRCDPARLPEPLPIADIRSIIRSSLEYIHAVA